MATASATSTGSPPRWAIFKTSASKASGSCRSIRRLPTTATTSPTTTPSTPTTGRWPTSRAMIAGADALGIAVMLDMVFNHTSNQHPWFVAAQNGDTTYLDYYVTVPKASDTTRGSSEAGARTSGIRPDTFKYCGYFSHTMPDLNFYSDAVKAEIEDISKFWIDKGVKGFRLDAVRHYYGENEYLDETYDFYSNIIYLDAYSAAIDAYAEDIYVIGEAYIESDYKIVASYFYGLDAPSSTSRSPRRLRSAAQKTTNYNYAENLEVWYDYYRDINPNFIDAPFIVNHDMDRFASQMLGSEAMMKLAAEMLLVLPGNPIIYYGEELGMFGVKAMGPDIWDETRPDAASLGRRCGNRLDRVRQPDARQHGSCERRRRHRGGTVDRPGFAPLALHRDSCGPQRQHGARVWKQFHGVGRFFRVARRVLPRVFL
ncbi:MAG: alpha-amylase family glycosyl hydrolase [Bacillus subtilis]|nr:alpha-amylase family glycosyl hydrolase [Bacillus subtilis]